MQKPRRSLELPHTKRPDEAAASMRPPSVYAKPSCPATGPCDLLRLLHGPHRVGCRLVMILLSQQGLAAADIAGLLGYDPSTVRRWIHRYREHGATGLDPMAMAPELTGSSASTYTPANRSRGGSRARGGCAASATARC